MKTGKDAIAICGFVPAHAPAFAKVALELSTVVSSRDLNKNSPGLLEEGYAAKGFHIKAKSCDYGPMAGFVCVEPVFSKKGKDGAGDQKKENDASLTHGCKQVQICISEARLKWLETNKVITIEAETETQKRILATRTWEGGKPLRFIADKSRIPKDLQATADGKTYALFYFDPLNEALNAKPWSELADKGLDKPLLGMANAQVPEAGPQPKGHKAAVAGDYDLFALWPHSASNAWTDRPVTISPDLLGKAAKMLPGQRFLGGARIPDLKAMTDAKQIKAFLEKGLGAMDVEAQKKYLAKDGKKLDGDKLQEFLDSANLEQATAFAKAAFGVALANEQEHMGNITLLLVKVKNKLNLGIKAAGYKGGNAVHHSDDAGNPFSSAPTYPLLFFVPGREPVALENAAELKKFAQSLADDSYLVKMNPKWVL